eukprot:TRINITY_DN16991_c0_g1_i1.p1 TRINITY_DN16991_c0_g1~~TRINITY_DN16991_c0_g1_i1.p1  ORF type:complete len:253 (+),score=35.02 TRINITY_DN16991_c0_g1_i1:42-761(+)
MEVQSGVSTQLGVFSGMISICKLAQQKLRSKRRARQPTYVDDIKTTLKTGDIISMKKRRFSSMGDWLQWVLKTYWCGTEYCHTFIVVKNEGRLYGIDFAPQGYPHPPEQCTRNEGSVRFFCLDSYFEDYNRVYNHQAKVFRLVKEISSPDLVVAALEAGAERIFSDTCSVVLAALFNSKKYLSNTLTCTEFIREILTRLDVLTPQVYESSAPYLPNSVELIPIHSNSAYQEAVEFVHVH